MARVPALTPAAEPVFVPAPVMDEPEISVEEELRQWKAQRRFRMPWRQVWLMASLCFGIGSFVLPDSVNDAVDWILDAMMVISFCIGIFGRFGGSDAAASRTRADSQA